MRKGKRKKGCKKELKVPKVEGISTEWCVGMEALRDRRKEGKRNLGKMRGGIRGWR